MNDTNNDNASYNEEVHEGLGMYWEDPIKAERIYVHGKEE